MALISLVLAADQRQLQRELTMLTPQERHRIERALDAGEQVIWVDEVPSIDGLTMAPRLCFG